MRDPIELITAIDDAFNEATTDQAKVLAVRDALLTEPERVAIEGLDEGTWTDVRLMREAIESLLQTARYTAPENFSAVIWKLGQVVLSQVQIAAISAQRATGVCERPPHTPPKPGPLRRAWNRMTGASS